MSKSSTMALVAPGSGSIASDTVLSTDDASDAFSTKGGGGGGGRPSLAFHMHAAPSAPTAANGHSIRQHGSGAVVGRCMACRALILEDAVGFRTCSTSCARPLVIHQECAMDTMLNNGTSSFRTTCTTCGHTLMVAMVPRFTLTSMFWWFFSRIFSPRFWFVNVWRVIKVTMTVWCLLVALGFLYKIWSWNAESRLLMLKYVNNPSQYGGKPPAMQPFHMFELSWRYGHQRRFTSRGYTINWIHLVAGTAVAMPFVVLGGGGWALYRILFWIFGLTAYRRRMFYTIKATPSQ